MKKITCLFLLVFCTFNFYAQKMSNDDVSKDKTDLVIPNFKMYPNPVSNGKLFITSSNKTPLKIQIFNILGKKIMDHRLLGKEMNIEKLSAGIYILKASIKELSVTRKLVVK